MLLVLLAALSLSVSNDVGLAEVTGEEFHCVIGAERRVVSTGAITRSQVFHQNNPFQETAVVEGASATLSAVGRPVPGGYELTGSGRISVEQSDQTIAHSANLRCTFGVYIDQPGTYSLTVSSTRSGRLDGARVLVTGGGAFDPSEVLADMNFAFVAADPISTSGSIQPGWCGVYADLHTYFDAGEASFDVRLIIDSPPKPKPKPPVFILPGIGGTYARDIADDGAWAFQRGIAPEEMVLDPISRVYDDLVQTLKKVDYVEDVDLFPVAYDWRLPPGPTDGTIDGRIGLIDADSITNRSFLYAVDYFGDAMRKAADAWELEHGTPLEEIDVICHSTGGLVARTYLQSAAYNAAYDGGARTLPRIRKLLMVGVPNRGASKPWRVLHDDWAGDDAYVAVLSAIVNRPYLFVAHKGAEIEGPDVFRLDDILGANDQPDPQTFIRRYVPTLRSLLATFPFVDAAGDGELRDVNSAPEFRNDLALDLNDGLDLRPTADPSPFASLCETTVIYSTTHDTPRTVRPDLEPGFLGLGLGHFSMATGFNDADRGQWDDGIVSVGGDGTVPWLSAAEQFVGDPRVELVGFVPVPGEKARDSTSHTGLMWNRQVQAILLDRLGVEWTDEDISTDLVRNAFHAGQAAASIVGTNADARLLSSAGLLSFVLDPVEGYVVDGLGRRLGWTTETGALTEIPGSTWVGAADGFGFSADPIVEPLRVELRGLGGPSYARLTMISGGRTANLVFDDELAPGATRTMTPRVTGPMRNLAIDDLRAPVRTALDTATASARVDVVLQNRGTRTETIPDAETLARVVRVDVASTGLCAAPVAALSEKTRFPIRLRPGKKITLRYAVEISCANDPLASTPDADHGDYVVTAAVDRAELDGVRDGYPLDDVAPRAPIGKVPGAPRKVRDRGAGRGTEGARRGGAVVIDVEVAAPKTGKRR